MSILSFSKFLWSYTVIYKCHDKSKKAHYNIEYFTARTKPRGRKPMLKQKTSCQRNGSRNKNTLGRKQILNLNVEKNGADQKKNYGLSSRYAQNYPLENCPLGRLPPTLTLTQTLTITQGDLLGGLFYGGAIFRSRIQPKDRLPK